MNKLAEFLTSITLENNQYCESKGYVPRFLDVNITIPNLTSDIISRCLTKGICRVNHFIEHNSDISELLTYLFYDIIRLDDTNSFQGANQKIINSNLDDIFIHNGLYQYCYNSNEIWVKVRPEYCDQDISLYKEIDFPSIGNTIIGYDSNDNSYSIMSGQLWFILTNEFGTKNSSDIPNLIIPSCFLDEYRSSWKINHEMSIHCMAATHRNSGALLDFEAGINKLSPYNFNLLSRNDLTAIGKRPFYDWTMILSKINNYDMIANKCGLVLSKDIALQIYTAKCRLEWFCNLLLR